MYNTCTEFEGITVLGIVIMATQEDVCPVLLLMCSLTPIAEVYL